MAGVANAAGMTAGSSIGNEGRTGQLRPPRAAPEAGHARQAGGRIDAAHLLRGEWRTLGRFVLEAFGAGLVVSLVLALAVFIITSPAMATTTTGSPAARSPREITFVVGTSGSMDGTAMTQAREALLLALDRLQAGDRFNVIEFNAGTHSLFAAPIAYDGETAARARRFVSRLRAGAGTAMLPALEIALAGERTSPILRQVVVLGDGATGNDAAILEFVGRHLGDRRLFTVGTGPAPNKFFMTRAAQSGRGSYTAIGDMREVERKIAALFRALESPAATEIAPAWPTTAA